MDFSELKLQAKRSLSFYNKSEFSPKIFWLNRQLHCHIVNDQERSLKLFRSYPGDPFDNARYATFIQTLAVLAAIVKGLLLLGWLRRWSWSRVELVYLSYACYKCESY